MEFTALLEEYIKDLNNLRTTDVSTISEALSRICESVRIAKISSIAYRNAQAEEHGRGAQMIGYDSGKKCVVGVTKRIVTPLMNIIDCKVFIEEGTPPWSDQELDRIRLIIESMTVYVSRLRINATTEKYVFQDDSGYKNQRAFVRAIEKLASKNSLAGMVAIHYNLKHFALVNQQIGREYGNNVMKNYYNDISDCIKGNGIVCRFGGDNFSLLCDKSELDEILTQLRGKAIVYDRETNDRIMVSASVGVFMIPDDFVYHDPGDIIDKIISSLNAARTQRKDDIVFFNETMVAMKQKMMRVQQIFPVALANEEFLVYYQPKINVNTGELVGAEALCRWFRNGTIVPPMEFIPVLEQSMDICKLDFYMLDHVCRDIRRWLDEGKKVVRVSVNLSRKHMMDLDLLQRIMDIINRNNVPHQYVEIELTETTTDVQFRDLKRVVSELRREGVKTAVDDFGMGYSSLNLIKEIPWDVLKVDRSFLPTEDGSANITAVMFRHVVAMARELGVECIAEGVETQHQVEVLRENGCDIAQGFLFDKPIPVKEFEERLEKRFYNVE